MIGGKSKGGGLDLSGLKNAAGGVSMGDVLLLAAVAFIVWRSL